MASFSTTRGRGAISRSIAVALLVALLLVAAALVVATRPGQRSTASGSTRVASGPTSSQTSSIPGLTMGSYDQSVPNSYQSDYATLHGLLDSFDQNLSASDDGQRHKVTFAAELLTANSGAGTSLLSPTAIDGVTVNLNALQAIGVTGVTVAIQYPISSPSFPNFTKYQSFYEQVAQLVHQRGMTMDVEAGVVFAGTTFTKLPVSYAGLTFDQYVAQKHQMVQGIIDDLHPDYVNLGSEPDTEYMLLHFQQLQTPDGYGSYLSGVLGGLDKGSTKVGAGTGAWDPIGYAQEEVTIPGLDIITLHVYPLYGSNFNTMVQVGELARQYNKSIVLDEAWDTKSVAPEGGGFASDSSIFARDVYGFWSPIDQEFRKEVVRYAEIYPVAYVSPFWEEYFFAYLNYSSSDPGLSYDQASTMVNQRAAQDMVNMTVTPTGYYYGQLIREYGGGA